MATRHCILYTRKLDSLSPHEKISKIAGRNSNGRLWVLTVKRAVEGWKNGTWKFFVKLGDSEVEVKPVSRNGYEYLRTEADGIQPNNLLSLPDIPAF